MATGLTKIHHFMAPCLAILSICLSSCENDKHLTSPYENNLGIKPATIAQIDTANYTSIEWSDPNMNFGTLDYGDSAIVKFRFRNTGSHPLFISGVKPSCGCTVPEYPKEPVMPNKGNELRVSFHSIGQADTVYKTILVTTNTSNSTRHLLSIEGIVKGRTIDSLKN